MHVLEVMVKEIKVPIGHFQRVQIIGEREAVARTNDCCTELVAVQVMQHDRPRKRVHSGKHDLDRAELVRKLNSIKQDVSTGPLSLICLP